MKTNFKNYLKRKKAQEVIDKLAEQYKVKKVGLYGIDLFTGDLFRNYDLSKLGVQGIADRSFHNESSDDYYGYKKLNHDELTNTDFDVLLITTYDDTETKSYLKKDLFKNKKNDIQIKTLIKMNLFEYIKGLMNGDI